MRAINVFKQTLIRAAALACLATASYGQGGTEIGFGSVSTTPGANNVFSDVTLTNIGAPIDVASFAFEISAPGTDVTFESATTGTTAPYIFAGDSFDVNNSSALNTSSPGQTLDASDLTNDAANVVVGEGQTVGLGRIFFNINPAAPSELITVSFNDNIASTDLSDASGDNVPITQFLSGTITISPVPEPGTLSLAGLALAIAAILVAYSHNHRARVSD
jgi:hypothetical protein